MMMGVGFGFADLLDIAVVASLLYFLLLWFKQTKSAFVATGIFILAIIYVVARQAGMYLTTWILQGFFAVILIALVVIFQEELRSFFERLAVWSLGRRRASPLQSREVEALLHTIAHFAREEVGALVVLKGRDPLERHVQGGHELDGVLSGPLLQSIFNRHSEAHDGAVLIDGNRITRFGVHLPLSKEFHKLAGLGTRHAAALGLSERTDGLCIVVSEEKGTISICREGTLKTIQDLQVLEEQINHFLKERRPQASGVRWSIFLRHHSWEKAVSIVLAVILWLLFVRGFKPATQTFHVPVEAQNVPAHLRIVAIDPPTVRMTLAGLKRDFTLLNPRYLKVNIDLQSVSEPGKQRVMLSEHQLQLPKELYLVNLNPPMVELHLESVQAKQESASRFLVFSQAHPSIFSGE